MILRCPWCGASAFFSKAFSSADAPPVTEGMLLACPDCLEFIFGTKEQTLRKATAIERREVMRHPIKRVVMEEFAFKVLQLKRLQDQLRERERRK